MEHQKVIECSIDTLVTTPADTAKMQLYVDVTAGIPKLTRTTTQGGKHTRIDAHVRDRPGGYEIDITAVAEAQEIAVRQHSRRVESDNHEERLYESDSRLPVAIAIVVTIIIFLAIWIIMSKIR